MKRYAIACSVIKTENCVYTHDTTIHIVHATSLEEAQGVATVCALKMKPGFAVAGIVSLEIQDPFEGN